jgi:hypothetical protein
MSHDDGKADCTMAKQRYRREGDTLRDDDLIVLRGGVLDAKVLREDAQRNHAIYGVYGISVFALRDATVDELAQQPPLVRFEMLTLVTVGALSGAALELEATGRNPRHFDVVFGDLQTGIERLCACEHRVILNPYYEV